MGRAKLKMETISNQKSRNSTFKKRKDGLIKKLHEFTTLCDVDACMVIYHNTSVDIWPQNRDEVRRIIDLYKAKKQGNYNNKTCGLSDFFQERQRKAEEQLSKLRKNNMEAKYPVWDDFFNFLTESQLRQFAVGLNNKLESVKSRIELLKTMKNNNLTDNFLMYDQSQSSLNQFTDEWAHDDLYAMISSMEMKMEDEGLPFFDVNRPPIIMPQQQEYDRAYNYPSLSVPSHPHDHYCYPGGTSIRNII